MRLCFDIFGALENQLIYPNPKEFKLISFAPLGDGVNEEPTTRNGGARRSQNQLNTWRLK
jgi:hypothetical protein